MSSEEDVYLNPEASSNSEPLFDFTSRESDFTIRILVYLVIHDFGQVSLEHLVLSLHPSQRSPASVWSIKPLKSHPEQQTLSADAFGTRRQPPAALHPKLTLRQDKVTLQPLTSNSEKQAVYGDLEEGGSPLLPFAATPKK